MNILPLPEAWSAALLGGVVLGTASILLLLGLGRIFGISGIVGGLLEGPQGDKAWRLCIVAGLVFGGVLLQIFRPWSFAGSSDQPLWQVGLAGLLVGFGTRLGSGCTSGHGVCGVARLSGRSLAATLIFLLTGALTATLMHGWR